MDFFDKITDTFNVRSNDFKAPDAVKAGADNTETKLIEDYIGRLKDEKVRYYYFNRSDNVVVLTNFRFIKIENKQLVSNVLLDMITEVNHERNGLFSWDKVYVKLSTGGTETFGINNKNIVSFFVKIISMNLKKRF